MDKYDFDKEIESYKNIVLISRKSLLSQKNNLINCLIFSQNKYDLVDIDILLEKMIKYNKRMYIFCGDDHSYKKSIIYANNKNICEIITCGPINTVPELFKNEIILNTELPNIKIKNVCYELVNNFMQIKNGKSKLDIKNIKKEQSMIYYLFDSIISVYNIY